MSKYNFYKLKKDEHDWKIHTIPEGRKVPLNKIAARWPAKALAQFYFY